MSEMRSAENDAVGPRLSDGCMTPRTEGHYCLTCGSYTCPHAHATYVVPPAATDGAA